MSKHKEHQNQGNQENQEMNESSQGQKGQQSQKSQQGDQAHRNEEGNEQTEAQKNQMKAVEEQNKRSAQMSPHFSQEQLEQSESQQGDDLEMKGLTVHGVDASSPKKMTQERQQAVQEQMSRGNRPQAQKGFENVDQNKLRKVSEKMESDEEFKKEFERDSKAALEKEGIKLPEGVEAYEASKFDSEKRQEMNEKAHKANKQAPQEFRAGKIVLVKE